MYFLYGNPGTSIFDTPRGGPQLEKIRYFYFGPLHYHFSFLQTIFQNRVLTIANLLFSNKLSPSDKAENKNKMILFFFNEKNAIFSVQTFSCIFYEEITNSRKKSKQEEWILVTHIWFVGTAQTLICFIRNWRLSLLE